MRSTLKRAIVALVAGCVPCIAVAEAPSDYTVAIDAFCADSDDPKRLNSVPVVWCSRIVAHVPQMKGWRITPSHFANQDLADVWLDL